MKETTTTVWIFAALTLVACNALTDLDQVEREALERQQCTDTPDCKGGEVCIEGFCQSQLCAEYCWGSMERCRDDHAIYANEQECLGLCEGAEPGYPGEQTGNTIHCRLHHLGMAEEDPGRHCPHVAPDGGGVCVGSSPCSSYCDVFIENCAGEPDFFESSEACFGACSGYDKGGSDGDEHGPTLQCRMTHAEAAATGDKGAHCANAFEHGGEMCH